MESVNSPKSGIVLLDKPAGISSQAAVTRVKKLLHIKTAGHAGTLDPIATGLLIVCFGRATRAAEYLTGYDKKYEAVFKTGISTDTCDITGEITASSDYKPTAAGIEQVLPLFTGRQMQRPPRYSAIRTGGRRFYELARRGSDSEPEEREIYIHSLRLLFADEKNGLFTIAVHCSKGTYIRALCRDICKAAGGPGTMAALRRTAIGKYGVERAVTLEDIAQKIEKCDFGFVLGIDSVFDNLPALVVDDFAVSRIKNGAHVPAKHVLSKTADRQGRHRVYSRTGDFIAVCVLEDGALNCEKSFFEI